MGSKVFITGDIHGNIERIVYFCQRFGLSEDDLLIILGDVGANYYGGKRDMQFKEGLNHLGVKLLCVHGNHENRPSNIESYRLVDFCGGKCYQEEAFPNILFAKDGEIYNILGNKVLTIGGAYSVDKYYRLENGNRWWQDEQPDENIKQFVTQQLVERDYSVDIVLSHTCPYKYRPVEQFLPFIDQSTVDESTELWLGTLEEKLTYKDWYCGHWHTDKTVDKVHFLFEGFKVLDGNCRSL